MDFTKVLYKVLKNEPLSKPEFDILAQWLASKEGLEVFNREIANRFESFESDSQIDCGTLLEKAHHIMARAPKKRLRTRLRIAAASAAVIGIVAGCLFGGQLFDGGWGDVPPGIDPGNTVAILQLHDGRNLHLDVLQEEVIEQDGAVISMQGGAIVYRDGVEEFTPAYNKLIIPRGGEYKVTLGDGTTVWLNSCSTLEYPLRFTGNERRVRLEGEAYFEVTQDEERPFIVETFEQTLTVLGTKFNILAYSEEKRTVTALAQGKVRVVCHSTSVAMELLPGQQAYLDTNQSEFTVSEVNVGDIALWKSGFFVFEEQSLEQVMVSISRWYDIEVSFGDANLRDIVFKGTLPKYEDLETPLEMIEKIGSVKFEMKGRTLRVKKI